jgi:Arc/MetJ-type ribon-helix-helix transcriptional regulator
MDTTVVTLRLPSDLVEWIDSVGKRGAVVAKALELMRSPKRVALTDCNLELIRAAVLEVLAQQDERRAHNAGGVGSTPGPEPDIAALRAICAANVPKHASDSDSIDDITPRCCECDKQLLGKVYRGRVTAWACSDAGCPMYGRELKV